MIRIHESLNTQLLKPGRLEAFKKGLVEKKPLAELLDAEVLKNAGLADNPPQGSELSTLVEYYGNKEPSDLARPQAKFDFLWSFMNAGQKLAAFITAFWTHGLFLVLVGFAYCLFWCSGTIIYFLLRKEVDDTEMDEVYIEDERDFTPPPLASSVAPVAPPPVLPTSPVQAPPVVPPVTNSGSAVPPPPSPPAAG